MRICAVRWIAEAYGRLRPPAGGRRGGLRRHRIAPRFRLVDPSDEGRGDSARTRRFRGNSTGDSFACRFYWRQAGLAVGKDAVSLRWTFRVSPAVLVREAVAEHPRRGRKIVAEKVKGKAFARAVNRDDVINGAAEMGLDLDAHIEFCIGALQNRAELLGLQGTVQSRKPILAGAGPGLQNQRTSRKRRGGFDSHWLPPHPLTYYTCRNSLFGNGYWVLSAPS